MTTINSVTLGVPDGPAARAFYEAAFDLGPVLSVSDSDADTRGFRGFTMSLVVSQPATVDVLVGAALDAGGTAVRPVKKSFWGYGGTLRAPDGTLWKVATSAKRDSGPPSREVDELVVLLGVADVAASRRFYVEHGLVVAKSFGRRYVQFDTGPAVTLALYGRRALARDAGVDPEGSGSPRLVIGGDLGVADDAGAFDDPDGFAWEVAPDVTLVG